MDMTYVYMVLLAICIIMLAYLKIQVREKREKQKGQKISRRKELEREENALVGENERVAPIAVTNFQHTMNSGIRQRRERSLRHFTVQFSFIDESGQMQYGAYDTENQADLMSVNRVAYHVDDPTQYRMLGRSYKKEFIEMREIAHTPVEVFFLNICINFFGEKIWNKEYDEALIVILWIAIFVLVGMLVWQFYQALYI